MRCVEHNQRTQLYLMPDYASTGVWCKECGCNLGSLTLPHIPKEIFDLVEGWVSLWDFASMSKTINRKFVESLILKNGKTLCGMVNRYQPCTLATDKLVWYHEE